MEDEQQSSSIRTTIDPEGDLVLVVEEQELLVSRNVLCLSSVVFRAMLGKGSDFLELKDQVMSTDDHQLIHLKDDNYKAVKIVACAIHMQYDMVPMEVSFEELGTIATLCDKYDLRKGLVFGLRNGQSHMSARLRCRVTNGGYLSPWSFVIPPPSPEFPHTLC